MYKEMSKRLSTLVAVTKHLKVLELIFNLRLQFTQHTFPIHKTTTQTNYAYYKIPIKPINNND